MTDEKRTSSDNAPTNLQKKIEENLGKLLNNKKPTYSGIFTFLFIIGINGFIAGVKIKDSDWLSKDWLGKDDVLGKDIPNGVLYILAGISLMLIGFYFAYRYYQYKQMEKDHKNIVEFYQKNNSKYPFCEKLLPVDETENDFMKNLMKAIEKFKNKKNYSSEFINNIQFVEDLMNSIKQKNYFEIMIFLSLALNRSLSNQNEQLQYSNFLENNIKICIKKLDVFEETLKKTLEEKFGEIFSTQLEENNVENTENIIQKSQNTEYTSNLLKNSIQRLEHILYHAAADNKEVRTILESSRGQNEFSDEKSAKARKQTSLLIKIKEIRETLKQKNEDYLITSKHWKIKEKKMTEENIKDIITNIKNTLIEVYKETISGRAEEEELNEIKNSKEIAEKDKKTDTSGKEMKDKIKEQVNKKVEHFTNHINNYIGQLMKELGSVKFDTTHELLDLMETLAQKIEVLDKKHEKLLEKILDQELAKNNKQQLINDIKKEFAKKKLTITLLAFEPPQTKLLEPHHMSDFSPSPSEYKGKSDEKQSLLGDGIPSHSEYSSPPKII